MNRVCGNCTNWARADNYNWGKCEAVTPFWVGENENTESPILFSTEPRATDCETFYDKTKSEEGE